MKSGFRAVVRLYSGLIGSCRAATPGFSIYQSGENFKMVATIKCPCMIEKYLEIPGIYREREINNELWWNMIEGSLEVKLPTIWIDGKAEVGRVREEKRREKIREGKESEDQKKEDAGARTVCFQWFVAPEGQKVGSLKRRVRSHLARWEMKNCMPLWHEAHFEINSVKNWQVRTTFGSWDVERCTPLWREAHLEVKRVRSTFGGWDVEKVHAPCGAKHISKSNCTKHTTFRAFWKLRCRKSARCCGEKHISKSECWKHHMFVPLLDVEASFCVAGARDSAPCQNCQKVTKTWGFCSISKNDGSVWIWRGSAKMIKDAFRVACAIQETCSSEMLGGHRVTALISWEGLHFGASDRQVCEDDFAWQVQHFVWSGITFSWQAQYFRQMEWKNRKTHWYEAVSSALNFLLLKEVSQNCFVLVLSIWKIEEVSQNCFVFDVVNLENCGSLAELLRFWRCQLRTLRRSRRIASFSTLQIDRQTDRQIWRIGR